MQIFAYQDLHNFIKSNPSFNDLVIFHTSYKYLIYSKAQKSYTTLGRIVANKDKKQLDEILLEYKEEFLKAISLKGNVNKTYNVLLHMFGYFKKLITMPIYKAICVPNLMFIKYQSRNCRFFSNFSNFTFF